MKQVQVIQGHALQLWAMLSSCGPCSPAVGQRLIQPLLQLASIVEDLCIQGDLACQKQSRGFMLMEKIFPQADPLCDENTTIVPMSDH